MNKQIFLAALLLTVNYTIFAQVADSTRRHLALQGAANFRDLGGYKTTDGKTVKWGKIYRSADISKLTDADLAVLKEKKITYDVDLRGHQEAEKQPDRVNPGTDYILCPAGSDSLGNWMKELAAAPKNSGDSIMGVYYGNTKYLTDRYKPFFGKLLAMPADQSLVFHCTAGKDRTGIAAALFLYSLGVPYKTIVADYTATNYYLNATAQRSIKGMVGMMHMDEQTARSMMAAKKQYLDATFAAINAKYGSVDNFIKDQLGLNNKELKVLKSKYLD